jgi:hypothetical protein
MEKITKNNLSYFMAGFKAGQVDAGEDPNEIERLDYTTTEFGNKMRQYCRAYDSKEFDDEGLKEMYKIIKS